MRALMIERAVAAARATRAELLGRDGTPRDLTGQCGLAAMRVADILGDPDALRVGFFMKREILCGRRGRYPNSHAWCLVDDTIVDPTATQFDRRLRAVHVVIAAADDRYIETASSADAVDVIMLDWLGRKIPEYKRLAKTLRRRCP